MLEGSFYHLLESLLPPTKSPTDHLKLRKDGRRFSIVHGQDLLRLEYLSACKVMQDRETTARLLPAVPHKLYPALFEAAILHSFYSRKGPGWKQTTLSSSVIPLILHWPYETMCVRELIPPLPPPLRKCRGDTLNSVGQKLQHFYDNVMHLIPHTFLQGCTDTEGERNLRALKTLDVSGHYTQVDGILSPTHLLQMVKKAYNPNTCTEYERFTIVVDARIDDGSEKKFNDLGIICTLSQHHGAVLVVKLRSVHIVSVSMKKIQYFIELLANNGTECLELEMCDVDDSGLDSLLCMSECLTSLSLAYNRSITSLHFLAGMSNLSQINLSGIRLRDKVEALSALPRGLEYLKMVGCFLKSPDLEALSTTKHMLTLRQLDLSENSFGLPADFFALCNLCKNLVKISVLELEGCFLNVVVPESLTQLVNILSSLPDLCYLRLTRNDFSSRVIRSHLSDLAHCKSLQYLCLTTPSDMYISDVYSENDRQIKQLHNQFDELLQAVRETQIHVEWTEEASYSHWFYTI
ncbi:leucine-rich repeat-containing protein 14-like [Penaeus japonicus]|uniref:leucine-rich repeat-containing protein 14-like n=1 Tax=Penaeus japonicus TaxID=27405 RepID=UPI001C70E117|nr:leucine-rich repeat-containing protein 14-like [Penaeus japonicus]XP_042891298.1 leucine-rich repeat-containing protein 14-like [Penaeus japonicus]XP_042891299.1 leucine-rich repeat-containing protein 14-like [Penaeus japonicus]XP_042891300.1 leucine-rich repeat-containing protein 14-like [Penaeus japonicus]XP_042891301.1 leucine-rich repeat-containing protein 14-like [Penaeus japonicus]XP_042891303.1 leucine-rich repeat-containing protein 14-like [Penaeus japonicus]XP_042891304.1 leucine-